MSHFTVLVIGENPENQLAPYHEFECTGEVDQYVQTIDRTDEARQAYMESTESMLRGPTGELVEEWDDSFYREPTPEEKSKIVGTGNNGELSWTSRDWKDGKGYRAKIHHIPEGWTKEKVPTQATESFSEFVEGYYGWKTVPFGQKPDLEEVHKFGWVELDADGNVTKCFDRTNPNKKWDWYTLGGRWTGFFKVKAGGKAVIGRPGVFGEKAEKGHADQLRKGDIDIEGMRADAENKAAVLYDRVHSVIAGRDWMMWEEVRNSYDPDFAKAREVYNEQEVIKDVMRTLNDPFLELEHFKMSREDYLSRARTKCLQTFAVVKDGKWYERGTMGWWGTVSDEKSDMEWSRQFYALLDSLPDDTMLSVYDCHI